MTTSLDRHFPGAAMAEIEPRTRAALAANGFGVLTEIDVQAVMKAKLDKDLPAYRILGACNPQIAYRAICVEPRIGAMMPCNVILRETDGGVEVSAVDLVASWQAYDNAELAVVAADGRDLLAKMLAAI